MDSDRQTGFVYLEENLRNEEFAAIGSTVNSDNTVDKLHY